MLHRLKNLETNFTVAKAASIVGLFALITKISALFRERIFAATFGQGQTSDAYFSAFRIPDFITTLFVLSTLSVAFLPIFTKERTKSEQMANDFSSTVLNACITFIGVLCLLLFLFSEPLTKLLVPGFHGQAFIDTLNLTRLFLLSPIIFAVSTLFSGFLNAKKKFLITSFAPILYNLGIIFGIIFLYPKYGIIGLGWGVILGAVTQALIQIISGVANGFRYKLQLDIHSQSFRQMLKLYLPRILTFDLANVTLLLTTVIASASMAGSITAINQAFNLQAVPIGIFAYALASAAFPLLAEQFAEKKEEAFVASLRKVINQILFFMIPATVLMIVFRAFIVRLILGAGKFNWENTITTFQLLGIFSLSLLSQSLTTLLARAFYARHNTKIPVITNIVSIAVNVILSFLMAFKYGPRGLVYAFVLASTFNALTLFVALRKKLIREAGQNLINNFDSAIIAATMRIIFASLIMGLVSYGLIYVIAPFVNTRTFFGILIQSGFASLGGILVYLLMALALKMPEVRPILKLYKKDGFK